MSTSPMIARYVAESNGMTKAERSRLVKLEEVIERGIPTFFDTGIALAEVRESRLYREDYESFDDYCIERWGFTRQRVSQIVTAAEICKPLVDTDFMPATERQARELKHVAPERRAEVMEEASENGPPTAASVRRAAAAAIVEQAKPEEDRKPEPAPVVAESGEEVPERLEWAFKDMGAWAAIDSGLRAVKKQIKELSEQNSGVFLDFMQIAVDLKNVSTAIKFARPYGICPECGAKNGGCKVCRQQGFVPKDVHARATAAGGDG